MRQVNVNGKGAVFQVSDDKWVAKVCLGVDDNGKPIIKQFSGKTEAIAKKKLRDFKKSTDYVEKHIPSTDRDFDFGKEHKKRKNINYLQKRLDIASKM